MNANTKVSEIIQPGVTLTFSAYRKVQELLDDVNEPSTALRIYIQGGGCAGYEYGFQFDTNVGEDEWLSLHITDGKGAVQASSDWVTAWEKPLVLKSGSGFPPENVYVVVDPYSYPLIDGAILDYVDNDPSGRRFIFKNPRAKTTCGCGSSFST